MLVWAQSQGEWASRAYAYMEQDSLAQAEECVRHAVEAAPASKQTVMLLTNLGTVQRRRGKVHEAVDSYTKALGYSPLDVSVLMNRALAYMTLGNDDKAYTDLCNVLDKRTDHAEALYYRAFIYTGRREYAAARADYKRLLALQPADAYLYVARAELYLKMKRRTAAKADLDRAVALGLPRISLGELYKQCE